MSEEEFTRYFCHVLMYSEHLCAKSLQSCPTLCDPIDHSLPDCSVHGFSRQEYWSGLPFHSPGDLPNAVIEPVSVMFPALAGRFFTHGATLTALKRD